MAKASTSQEKLHAELTSEDFQAQLRACKTDQDRGALHAAVCDSLGIKVGPSAAKAGSGGAKKPAAKKAKRK